MSALVRTSTLCALAICCLGGSALAEYVETLIVATKEAPPFSMKSPTGEWSGISIELWREVAQRLHVESEFKEESLNTMLDDVESGSVSIAVAALTVTAAREARVDFTHPMFRTGLAVAVRAQSQDSLAALREVTRSRPFLEAVLGMFGFAMLVGFLIWLMERRRNPAHFGGKFAQGIGSGIWWSAVTMTTVGYGDKSPITPAGRALAVLWMFASIILLSTFTAVIASALTVDRLRSPIGSASDLRNVVSGTVAGSTSDEYLAGLRSATITYPDLPAALAALADRRVQAVVYDAPLLKFALHQHSIPGVKVLPFLLQRQDYALAVPNGSPLRERVNKEILKILDEEAWANVVARYLGNE